MIHESNSAHVNSNETIMERNEDLTVWRIFQYGMLTRVSFLINLCLTVSDLF